MIDGSLRGLWSRSVAIGHSHPIPPPDCRGCRDEPPIAKPRDISRARVHAAASASSSRISRLVGTASRHVKPTRAPTTILGLQRTIGNRRVQRLLRTGHHARAGIRPPHPRGRALQRQRTTGEEFKPCPTAQWYIPWHSFGAIPGGPYATQGISIAYDKIAPVPDPTKGADAQEQRKVFTTPSLLEQLYHDATVPLGSTPNRHRALWFVCIIEDVAKEIGFEEARDLHKIGCLTIQNCGTSWSKPLANFSDKTASGRRLKASF